MELAALLPQVLTSLFREIVYGPPGDMAGASGNAAGVGPVTLSGFMSSVAHTAYHMGAIRQLVPAPVVKS